MCLKNPRDSTTKISDLKMNRATDSADAAESGRKAPGGVRACAGGGRGVVLGGGGARHGLPAGDAEPCVLRSGQQRNGAGQGPFTLETDYRTARTRGGSPSQR